MYRKKYSQFLKSLIFTLLVIIAIVIMLILGWIRVESLWFIFPLSGIRFSTLAIALVCFTIVLYKQSRNTWRSLYFAILTVIFSMSLFEILWYYSAAAYRGWDLRIMAFAALFGWVMLGLREVYRTRPPKIAAVLYLVFILTFSIWLATGFSFNDLNGFSFSIFDEVLNVTSKTPLFLAYTFHLVSVK